MKPGAVLADYLAGPFLDKFPTFGHALFDELEKWREAIGKTRSAFARHVGVEASTYHRWADEGKVPSAPPAEVYFTLLGRVLDRRREVADKLGLKSQVRTVDAHGEPLDFERFCRCPVCGRTALHVNIRRRSVAHTGPFPCPLATGQLYDLLEFEKVIRNAKGEPAQS